MITKRDGYIMIRGVPEHTHHTFVWALFKHAININNQRCIIISRTNPFY